MVWVLGGKMHVFSDLTGLFSDEWDREYEEKCLLRMQTGKTIKTGTMMATGHLQPTFFHWSLLFFCYHQVV